MDSPVDEQDDTIIRRALDGDAAALNELLAGYRERLRRMVQLRMNRRLRGRVDPSDVVQNAYLEVSRVFDNYRRQPGMAFYLWLRKLTGQKLIQIHRTHLGAAARAADREVSLHRGGAPDATSESLAEQLVGRVSSPSQAAIRAERARQLEEALNSMSVIDREVLALRHFEQLSGPETAEVLGISHEAVKKRYIRALERLEQILGERSSPS
jgi:RNA polymerase sigma-70 factor (ECF subfamily)